MTGGYGGSRDPLASLWVEKLAHSSKTLKSYVNAPYLHPCAWKEHSRVPAECLMLFYKAHVLGGRLKGKRT